MIELMCDLKVPGTAPIPTKVQVIPGVYPVLIIELKSQPPSTAKNKLITEIAQKYQLDLSRITIIAHYTPEPLNLAGEKVEWAYNDLKDRNSQTIDIGKSSIRKLDVNLVNALLENSGKAEEMRFNSKANGVLLHTLPNGGWEVYLTFNDGKRELEATFTERISQDQAQSLTNVIAKERGFEAIQED